jgi:hypothetical protein
LGHPRRCYLQYERDAQEATKSLMNHFKLPAVALLAAVATLGACGAAKSTPPSPATTPSPTPTRVIIGGMPVRPHLQKEAGGRVLVTGWLRHIDLEGGFWATSAQPPGVTTGNQTVIAVLLPGSVATADIASHDGAYLIVEGTMSAGVSSRMSGPEVLVDSVKLLGMGQ